MQHLFFLIAWEIIYGAPRSFLQILNGSGLAMYIVLSCFIYLPMNLTLLFFLVSILID